MLLTFYDHPTIHEERRTLRFIDLVVDKVNGPKYSFGSNSHLVSWFGVKVYYRRVTST